MADTKPRTPRATRILLIISLALNLCVIGIGAGLLIGGGGKDRMQRFDLTVGPLTRALEPERRDAIRDQLRDSGAFAGRDREATRRDLRALLDTLRADTFDAPAFADILDRQRTRLQSTQGTVVTAIVDQISDMTPEQRSAYADRLQGQFRQGTAPPPRDTN